MKLTITLTDDQREELQDSADHLAKLLKKLASLEKQHADYEGVKVKATARLAAVEKTASEKVGEEAGEAASTKAFAIRDQLMRLENTLRLLEREFAELEKEAAQAAFIARKEIRRAHLPLTESLISEAAALLAPFCERAFHARNAAEQLYAVEQLRHFTRPNMEPNAFRSSGSITLDMESIHKTLVTLVAGEAVVTAATGGEEGGLRFPQFC
jgi:hypothetical protein